MTQRFLWLGLSLYLASFTLQANTGTLAELQACSEEPECQYELGLYYLDNDKYEYNRSEGLKWLRKAADQAYPDAQYHLGIEYMTSEYGEKKSTREGIDLLVKAAEQQQVDAMLALGVIYSSGISTVLDSQQAAHWYQQAANLGNTEAKTYLAEMYENGEGVPQDINKAVQLYQAAVEQHHPRAMAFLGLLYEEGRGVNQNFTRAKELYRESALSTDYYGLMYLGRMFKNGQAGSKDLETAYILTQIAKRVSPKDSFFINRELAFYQSTIPEKNLDDYDAKYKELLPFLPVDGYGSIDDVDRRKLRRVLINLLD